jgi:hypothetical protein
MSLHTVAYYQAATANAVLSPIPGVADGTVRVVLNDIYIPKGLNFMGAAAALINSAVATVRAQVQTPLLRSLLNYDVDPVANGLIFTSSVAWQPMFDTPMQLAENEPMEFWIQNGAAVVNQGLVWLADGPIKPVVGKIFTVRATGAAALSAGVWVNTALTFSQTLPAGHYQCVGLRAIGTNLAAARIFFVGGAWRPGVPAVSTDAGIDFGWTRQGMMGVLGEFDNTTPPTIDCLGTVDAAQIFFLDLIKTA